jgi:predicted DNA-binding protein
MRDTLKCVEKSRNLTINLPEQLIHRLRVCAAIRNQSMTTVVKEAIERTLVEDSEREAAASRLIRRLQNAPDRGIGGKVSWTREELHER